MNRQPERLSQKLLFPGIMIAFFWTLAVVGWRASGEVFLLINFGYIGAAVGLGLLLFGFLPRRRKHIGRKVAQLLVGVYMLGLLGIVGHENMQIEGFFFYLLAGYFGGAVGHYLVAKIVGPPIFNRGWCGWACWTAMVLDFLPYNRSRGWVPGRWGLLRYLHFALSLALVLVLVYSLGYRYEGGAKAFHWLIVGNIFYFASGIVLAIALRDNRAFCKYLCPIVVPLKLGAKFAMLRVAGAEEACDNCGACARVCPMDIDIPAYVHAGGRVACTECIICETCINSCPHGALRISFGFDCAKSELLVVRGKANNG